MEIIQNTHNTFQPNITTYYQTIQHLPNVLSFNELLLRFDNLKVLHNESYFNLLNRWECGELHHPPFIFGLESGAFFSAASIIFLYERNGKQGIKKLPYNTMSMYLGNKDSKFTNFIANKFSQADWDVIANFCNYCTTKYNSRKTSGEKRKAKLLTNLVEFKAKIAEQMKILEFDQLQEKHNNFNLFEADTNWNHFHWYRKGLASWKNGRSLYPPILFGLESGLMFGKTSFICCYSKDRGENESKRYYKKIDYRNINQPEFEERVGNYLTSKELEVLKKLGEIMEK
jgi:hypothetical protein